MWPTTPASAGRVSKWTSDWSAGCARPATLSLTGRCGRPPVAASILATLCSPKKDRLSKPEVSNGFYVVMKNP